MSEDNREPKDMPSKSEDQRSAKDQPDRKPDEDKGDSYTFRDWASI